MYNKSMKEEENKMLVSVWFDDEMHEMNKDLMVKMEQLVDDWSGNYCNYVLSSEWNDEKQCLHFFMDGPWEC